MYFWNRFTLSADENCAVTEDHWMNYLPKDEIISLYFLNPILFSFKTSKIKPSWLELLALDFPRLDFQIQKC